MSQENQNQEGGNDLPEVVNLTAVESLMGVSPVLPLPRTPHQELAEQVAQLTMINKAYAERLQRCESVIASLTVAVYATPEQGQVFKASAVGLEPVVAG